MEVVDISEDTALNSKIKQLEKQVENLTREHDKTVRDLLSKNESLIKSIEKLKKNIMKREMKLNKLKRRIRNYLLILVNFNMREKIEVKIKTEEKLNKIKENTKLFNKILEKQIAEGDIINVDLSRYMDNEMEICDGGAASRKTTGYGTLDLKQLLVNKNKGGIRNTSQDNTEIRKTITENVRKIYKCSKCEFMSQNELFFKEHMTNTHVTTVTKVIARIKPCRYFQYGSGRCSPRSGECRYDHTVVPDNERELCFHKEACKFKPHCIYFQPEGQENSLWEEVRKSSKICCYTVNGQTCWRSVCSYVQTTRGNNLGFHWERFTSLSHCKG